MKRFFLPIIILFGLCGGLFGQNIQTVGEPPDTLLQSHVKIDSSLKFRGKDLTSFLQLVDANGKLLDAGINSASSWNTAYSHSTSSHPFGNVGTKDVDETSIANGKVLKYNSTSGKVEYADDSGTAYTASELGIKLSGNQFSISLDGATLSQGASGLKVTDNTFAAYSHSHSGVYEPVITTLGISKGGTNNSSYTSSKFIAYDGSKLASTSYDNASFAASGHVHTGTYEPANANIQSHISSTSNPHSVTATQVLPSLTGNSGKFLTNNGTAVSWAEVAGGGGDITSVTAGEGLKGGGVANDVTLDINLSANGGLQIVSDSTGIKLDGSTLTKSTLGLKVTPNTFAAYSHNHSGVYEPVFTTLGIAKGGTNNTSYTSNKFLAYDGSKFTSTNYDNSSFAAAGTGVTNGDSHDHSGGDGAQIAYSNLSGLPSLGTISSQAANNVTISGGSISATGITLVQSASPAPTAEGVVQWDTDDNKLKVGDGAATKTFSDDSYNSTTYAASGHLHTGTYEPANANIQQHISNTSNPHSVTSTQVLPSQDGNSGKFLTTNGTSASWAEVTGGTGGGDITSVTAGEGLKGGGVANDVTLDINLSANGGLQIGSDSLGIKLDGTTLTKSTLGLKVTPNTFAAYGHNHSGVYEPVFTTLGISKGGTNNTSYTSNKFLAYDGTKFASTGYDNTSFAAAGTGVTNGDSHDHSGGDGAQIAYSNLSGLPSLGTIASQAANNVTISGGSISATGITLVQSASAAPTAEGVVQWDTDDNKLKIGDGAATKTFSDDSYNSSTFAASSHVHTGTYEPANANIQSHISSTSNPHSVTATQVLPSLTGNNGKFLTNNGTAVSWADVAGGSGDITSVVAGDGLKGGGTANDVTVDINLSANGGLQIVNDSTGVKLDGSTLTKSTLGLKVTPNTFAAYSHDHSGIYEPVFTTLGIAKGGTNATSFSANQFVRMNAGGTALESSGYTHASFSAANHNHDGSYAAVSPKFITQTAEAGLTNEQALSALATGILKNTTSTGVLSIAAAGTDYLSPTLTSAYLYIGNGSNVATGVAMSGDATISNTGAVTISDDSHNHTTTTVSGLDISSDTNLSASNGVTLTDDALSHTTGNGYNHIPSTGASTQLLQYSAAGTAKWITISGDATISDGGAITVANDSHTHGTSTISGLDISDDTNLSGGVGLVMNGDAVDLNLSANGGLQVVNDSTGLKLHGSTLTKSSLGLKVTDNTFAAYSHNHSGVYEPAITTLGISKGGTNNTTYTSSKFLAYDGTKLASTSYDNTSFAASSHVHTGTYEPANTNIQSHISSTSNPHSVTSTQVLPSQSGNTGKYLKTDGSAVSWATTPEIEVVYSITIDSTAISTSRRIPFFYTSDPVTIDTVIVCGVTTTSGGSYSVVPQISHDTDLSATGTNVLSSPGAATSKTTGTRYTSFTDATLGGKEWAWVKFTTVTTAPQSIIVTVVGRK